MQDSENKVKKEGANAEKADKSTKVYELGYLFIPTIKEEDLGAEYSNLKDIVASFGGEFISDEMPKMINLAYSMQKVTSNVRSKYNTAYFGWVKFYMDGESVTKLKQKLDLSPLIIRFLILKTVKENTIASKRFTRGDAYKKPKAKTKEESDDATPMDKEKIDQEIDALVQA